jgi:hypothetical protein
VARGKIPTPEKAIHQGIIDALRVCASPGVIYWHPANEGERNPLYAASLKRLGLLAGVPDLVFHLADGQTAFLEIKRPGGRLSPEQAMFQQAVMTQGCRFAVVRSIDEALAVLGEWGALRKGVRT